jgi:hypothetical protein
VRSARIVVPVVFTAFSSAAAQVTFTINPTENVQSISPYIYGVNGLLSSSQYQGDNLTLERAGGNRWTAYNWTNNYSNAGSDYEYSNDLSLVNGATNTAPGAALVPILSDAQSRNAAALITVPINGYVSAALSGYANPNQPPDESPYFVPEYPTESADPSPAADHVYEDQFIAWVKSNYPNGFAAGSQSPIFVDLDNEPDLWSTTHPEVHPNPTTYAELISDSAAYSQAIKAVAPNALVFGPVSYGWQGFMNLQGAPDDSDNNLIDPNTGKAYGDFISYYLAQMNLQSKLAGERLLDVLDVHWYPEATGANASGVQTRITEDDNSPGVAEARMQAPRSLWDPTYVEDSWITADSTGGQPIQLLPRLQGEINANYAGTKLSISEYNYGGGDNISGGIAEADVLGIFGKYGVFSAAEWPLLSKEPFIMGAFRMFRNYDGNGGTFGDTSISAADSDTVDTSLYASTFSTDPGKMVLVAINKTSSALAADFNLTDNTEPYSSFAVYQLTANSTITPDGDTALPSYVGSFPIADLSDYSMPADSVNTIVLSVPEPSSGVILCGGALLSLCLRRKRLASLRQRNAPALV